VEIATLDVVSGGRALIGVGAGHTPAEWAATGRPMPAPAARVDRLIEVTDATVRLLRGEQVSVRGAHVVLDDARLEDPRPVQPEVPLLVGGNGARVLRFAGGTADIVGVSGLGRTLPDGHLHEVAWSEAALDHTFHLVRDAASAAGRTPAIEALVQHVELTADARSAAERVAPHVDGATPDDLLAAPFVWIGTPSEIAARLHRARDRWGITRYVVREPALAPALEVLRSLTSG